MCVEIAEAYAATQNQKTQTTRIGVASVVQAVLEMTPTEKAEVMMKQHMSIFWCVKCSGPAPSHVQAYQGYNEATCAKCFFSPQ